MTRLLNGNTTERQRNSEGTTVLACGCAHTDILWLQMCDEHYAADHALHEQARADHAKEST